MRRAAALVASALLVTGAQAADYLRGPLPEPAATRAAPRANYDWSGTYIGGHYAYGSMSFNNYDLGGTALSRGIAHQGLATTLVSAYGNNIFGKANGNNSGFGGFIGVNTQWDDVVLGLEGEYTSLGVRAKSTSGALVGTVSSGNLIDHNLVATARTTIDDYFAFKARAGWAIDRTLLYATLGVAMANVTRQTTLVGSYEEYTAGPPRTSVSGVVAVNGAHKQSLSRWGFITGLGAEFAVTDNIILRGEWQYLGLGSGVNLAGSSKNGYYNLNTVRAGLAAKF